MLGREGEYDKLDKSLRIEFLFLNTLVVQVKYNLNFLEIEQVREEEPKQGFILGEAQSRNQMIVNKIKCHYKKSLDIGEKSL